MNVIFVELYQHNYGDMMKQVIIYAITVVYIIEWII